jgi:hypothetical protein
MHWFLAQKKAESHRSFIIPIWLLVCTGIWLGPLYYFGRTADAVFHTDDSSSRDAWINWGWPQLETWVKVGCGFSALTMYA